LATHLDMHIAPYYKPIRHSNIIHFHIFKMTFIYSTSEVDNELCVCVVCEIV